jgi:hypothetical protein
MDVIEKYSALKSTTFQNPNAESKKLLEKITVLVRAIEYYQIGKWEKSVQFYVSFLDETWELINSNNWIRLFETVWYLAIVSKWSTSYLQVNALNFVHEGCDVKEHEDANEAYEHVETYKRNIDLEEEKVSGLKASELTNKSIWTETEGDNTGANMQKTGQNQPNSFSSNKDKNSDLKVFIHLLAHFQKVHSEKLTYSPQYLPKVLIAMFNMIGTLMVNSEQVTNTLVNSFEYFISQIDILQNENIEKFIQFFGDFNSCQQFKADFAGGYEFRKKSKMQSGLRT